MDALLMMLIAFAFGLCVGGLIGAWSESPKRDERGRFKK